MRIIVYTDGACSGNPGPGGWGAILSFPEIKKELSGYEIETTNNRMELKAAVEALKLIHSFGYTRVNVYSDSAYVVNAVTKGWIYKWRNNNWKTIEREDVKNRDLWEQLLKYLGPKVSFIKVKGHSGDSDNERVDKIAKREVEKAKDYIRFRSAFESAT